MRSESKPLALVTGVGPGTGAAIVRRFADAGYRVAMLARNADRLAQLEAEIPGSIAITCDVSQPSELEQAVRSAGDPEVIVHNAVGGAFGTFEKVDANTLQQNIEINTLALFNLARLTTPAMIAHAKGAIIITGNTSALRGKAAFAGFAPTKAAQRILAESLARDLGPKGIHVAYLIIDAVIDVPWARKLHHNKPDDFFISPTSIASEVYHLAHQPKDAWSFLAEVRPFHEPW